eukprot:14118253-Heterocapsa_arctica.AAC.1
MATYWNRIRCRMWAKAWKLIRRICDSAEGKGLHVLVHPGCATPNYLYPNGDTIKNPGRDVIARNSGVWKGRMEPTRR